jgi:aspartokinase/homoserine dehydrogenase 1
VLSGTLSYVFNVWDGTRPFSEVVRDAKTLGLHRARSARRPLRHGRGAQAGDPRAARWACEIELSDVEIESLVPEALRRAVLRYVGVVTAEGRAKVALLPYAQSHAFAGLAATDNVIAFSSARYASQPLVVRGPGAGPEVTAGGVFADLLRLATSLA